MYQGRIGSVKMLSLNLSTVFGEAVGRVVSRGPRGAGYDALVFAGGVAWVPCAIILAASVA
jgi:hypothetical protein